MDRDEQVRSKTDEEAAVVAAARGGDEAAFASLVGRYRRELQVHCYRMVGSFEDSEDLVQETFLRAWRKRESFQGRSTFRTWLYSIATNACLDAIARRPARAAHAETAAVGPGPPSEIPWLQPYPDELLEGIPAADDEPDVAVVGRETIELAFLVAIQHLPPRQRAVLILRDVLDWSAKETASLLNASVASVNSALQRARRTLKAHLPERRLEWAPGADPTECERRLLERYMDANDRGDAGAFTDLLTEDVRFTMPPDPTVVVGLEAVVGYWVEGGFGESSWGELRTVLTRANRQPAVANYLRRPGESEYRALALDVLRIEEGRIVEVTAFGHEVFPAFGLPATL
jgi:RNA polymerase sigma-70 factor (ECF subfamily)